MPSQLAGTARRLAALSYYATSSIYRYALSWQGRAGSAVAAFRPATRADLAGFASAGGLGPGAWHEGQAEGKQPGPAPTPPEQEAWDRVLSRHMADRGVRAGRITGEARRALFRAGVTLSAGFDCTWYRLPRPALWTPEEVVAAGQAVHNIARVFGNGARHIVGGARIVRMRYARYPLLFMGKRAPAFQQFLTTHVNDHAFRSPGTGEHTLTHEFGHYLHESQQLLRHFKRARSADYPNDHARTHGAVEDFAASFEVFVYESLGNPVIEKGRALAVDPSRRQFFQRFVRENESPNPGTTRRP
jgi:hypothetical protein